MAERSANLTWRSSARSHVGLVRKLNEDAHLNRSEIGLWAVADGMGGHDAGDFASQRVIDGLAKLEADPDPGALLETVKAAAQAAHRDLRAEAAARGGATIGTTLVALLAAQDHFACLWAGDSRLYRFRAGSLEQISRDHSLVQDLLAAGQISAEEARDHPQGNIITRAIGALEEPELERVSGEIQPGDLFLLCSDGLTGPVTDNAIAEILGDTSNRPEGLDDGLDRLIQGALAGGGRDNVTAILVQFADGLQAQGEEAHEPDGADDTLPPGRNAPKGVPNPKAEGFAGDALAPASAPLAAGAGSQELIGADFLHEDPPVEDPPTDDFAADDPPTEGPPTGDPPADARPPQFVPEDDPPLDDLSVDALIGEEPAPSEEPVAEDPSADLLPSREVDPLVADLLDPGDGRESRPGPASPPVSDLAAADDDLPGGGQDAAASIEKLLAEAEKTPASDRGKDPSDKPEGGGILGKFRLGRGKRKE